MTAPHIPCAGRTQLGWGSVLGRRERFRAAIGGEGLGRLPLARVHAALDGGGDEVGQRVGLVAGDLVEGAPGQRAVAAQPAREPEE